MERCRAGDLLASHMRHTTAEHSYASPVQTDAGVSVRLRNLGQHFGHRRRGEGDAEVSEWLAEIMRLIDDTGEASTPPARPANSGDELKRQSAGRSWPKPTASLPAAGGERSMSTDQVRYWADQIIDRLESMMSDDGKVRKGSVLETVLGAKTEAAGQLAMDAWALGAVGVPTSLLRPVMNEVKRVVELAGEPVADRGDSKRDSTGHGKSSKNAKPRRP
jgi:hypothetical protein